MKISKMRNTKALLRPSTECSPMSELSLELIHVCHMPGGRPGVG